MRDQHAHCGCEKEAVDWNRGRCEPAEAPEAEQPIHSRRQERGAQQARLQNSAGRRQM